MFLPHLIEAIHFLKSCSPWFSAEMHKTGKGLFILDLLLMPPAFQE